MEYSGISIRFHPSMRAPTAIYRLRNASVPSITSWSVPVTILRSAYRLAPTVSRNNTRSIFLKRPDCRPEDDRPSKFYQPRIPPEIPDHQLSKPPGKIFGEAMHIKYDACSQCGMAGQ